MGPRAVSLVQGSPDPVTIGGSRTCQFLAAVPPPLEGSGKVEGLVSNDPGWQPVVRKILPLIIVRVGFGRCSMDGDGQPPGFRDTRSVPVVRDGAGDVLAAATHAPSSEIHRSRCRSTARRSWSRASSSSSCMV